MKQEKPLRAPTKAKKKIVERRKKTLLFFSTWAIKEFVVEHTHVMGRKFLGTENDDNEWVSLSPSERRARHPTHKMTHT